MPRPRRQRSNAAAYVVLSLSGFVMVFPFLYQLSASFMSNPEVLAIPKRLLPGAAVHSPFIRHGADPT